MYIQGATQNQSSPFLQAPTIDVQIIIYTFTHDRFMDQAIKIKENKYNPPLTTIKEQGWTIYPLIIITARVHVSTWTQSIKSLKPLSNYPLNLLKNNKHSPHMLNIY